MRRRIIPGEEEERTIVRRAEPIAREIVEIREPPRPRMITHDVIHHRMDPPTPPPPRPLPEPEPRNDWVLVRRVRKRRRNRQAESRQSDTSSGEEVEEDTRMYGQYPNVGTSYYGRAHPWQMMFFQAPTTAVAMPYQYNVGALDLANMRAATRALPPATNINSTYEVSIPQRPVRTVDDSAIPDSGATTFNWGTTKGAAAQTRAKEYETRERVATYFEDEF